MAVDPRDELWNAAFDTWYDSYYEEIVSESLIARWLRLDEITKVAVAITAGGSAIAGLALWKQPEYAWLWPIIATVGAFLAIVTEKLAVSFKLRDHGDTMRAFSALRIELDTFMYRMRIDPNFDIAKFTDELVAFRKRFGESYLRVKSDSLLTTRLQRKCQADLNQRLVPEGKPMKEPPHV
jgi:hypothetical protein